jgi:uncharacterized protein YbjT (DUF2867 family)
MTKILVTGATGNIGRHVVAGLHARGADVRTLSRSGGDFPDGVEVVAGDLTEPGTLHSALSDVDSVFLLWPFLTSDGVAEVVAAIAEHARHVVYVSALSVQDAPGEGVWGQVEDAIRQTGLTWTFLRPGGFATNTLEWASAIRADEPVRMPYPEAGRSLIHERDIADVAVLALTEDGHVGRAYPLTGPAVLTQADQARVLGEVAGKPARVEELSREEARAGMLVWADEEFADSGLDYWASLVDDPEPVLDTVQELTGHPARTFEQWAHDHAHDLQALTTTEVAERYVEAFRSWRVHDIDRLMAPDVVRVAPMENDGKRVELRGTAEIMGNGQQLTQDIEIHGVEFDGPFPHGDKFAVHFTFDATHKPTGQRATSAKMSLYTVAGGVITREEVFYFDPPLA